MYAETVASIARDDMPLLLHGSGDVLPSEVSPETCRLVAALTTQYVAHLVDAALDAQQMTLSNDAAAAAAGGASRTGSRSAASRKRRKRMLRQQQAPIVPPASFPRSRNPPIPPPYSPPSPPPDIGAKSKGKTESTIVLKGRYGKRKRRSTDDYWDMPLPDPVIRGAGSKQPSTDRSSEGGNASSGRRGIGDDDGDLDDLNADEASPPAAQVPIDEWVGAAGVDFFETNRSRSAYVRGPSALTTQNFIFPICHDVYAYGRVLQVQNAKRGTEALLVDPVLMEMVRTEGQQHHHKKKKSQTKKNASSTKKDGNKGNSKKAGTAGSTADTSDPEDDDDDEDGADDDNNASEDDDTDDGGPNWPGLDFLLPVHR